MFVFQDYKKRFDEKNLKFFKCESKIESQNNFNDIQFYVWSLNRIEHVIQENFKNTNHDDNPIPLIPKIIRYGAKKTIFINFCIFCKNIHRKKNHVMLYLTTELGTSVSIQEEGKLVLKGRFVSKSIETLMMNYINEYVCCKSCRRMKTVLIKDERTRLSFLECLVCNAWRTVCSIKPGFIAKTKNN